MDHTLAFTFLTTPLRNAGRVGSVTVCVKAAKSSSKICAVRMCDDSSRREYGASELSLSSSSPPSPSSERPLMRIRMAGYAVAVVMVLLGMDPSANVARAVAEPVSRGAEIFENNCAACHLGGGNILPFARSKTLKKGALEKANLYDKEAMLNYVANGKGAMPAYKDKLSEEALDEVTSFILERAAQNWK